MKSSSEIQFINAKALTLHNFVRCVVSSDQTNPTPNTHVIAKQQQISDSRAQWRGRDQMCLWRQRLNYRPWLY